MVHMRKKYLELILLDLTKYDGSLTFAERSILTSLPIAEDLVSFVDEVDVSVSCSRRFGGYLLERLDQGAILNLDVLQMMSNSCDAINVFVLSAHRWRTQIASLPMSPHLPPPLEVICKEFEAFHQLSRKNGGGGKSRLVWALGLGRVLLSMMKGCCHIGEIVVDELQCSILLAISSGCSTLPELCKFGNFDMETAQSLLQSLSSSDPTRPGLVLLEGSMDVLSIHTKISINADFFIASSKSTVEIADPRSAVYATSSRVAWRRDVIDAAIARTMKALSRSTNKCSGLNIVAATMSKLREAHPRSLFTSNEVEDRLDSFHRSGLIDEVSGKSSPPRSNEEHLFPSIADASLTSAPPSRPTSLLEMQECLMQSIMASDEYCDSLTEEKCNRISFVPVVPFCNGLLHWVATKDWKVETRLEAIIVRSDLNDARPSYDALHDTGDSFSQVLLNMAGNLMNAAAFSLGALIHQTNLLLNQFYVAAHGLPLNQPLLSLESLVRPLSALRSSSVGLWADFLLREVVLVECVGMIGDFAKVFRYCVVEGDDDAPSMEALNAVISGQTLTSSDRWALWSHKFTMECPSAPPHPQRQLRDLYTLLVRCLDESASGSLEESDMVEGKSVERMTSDLSSRKLAFGTFMRATIAHQWAFMKGSAPAFMSQSHHISPPPVPEMAAKRVMLPWDPSEEAERQILLSLEALSGASSFLSPETCSKNGNIRSGLLPPRTNRPFNRSLLQSPFNSAKSQAAAEELCPSIQTTVSALAKMVGKALVVYQARPAIPAETDHLIHITASSIDLSMDLLTKINDDGLNLWWSSGECAPRSIRQVLSGAYDCLTAVLSEQPPLTHRASNHLFSQTAIPAVMESLHMNVDDLLHEQGKAEFAALISSLAQVTGSQWAQCAMSFAQANFNIDAFFEIHYGSSESSSSTMSCLFEPPVNSSQMNHTCEHCKLRRPLSAFRALSCGHFACMDCWAIRTMRAIDSNAVRVGCIGTPSGRYCPMAMKVEAVAQVASEGVNFQRYLSNLFR